MSIPKAPWHDRDRLILSKGHAAPALYATLMLQGFFPEAELWQLRQCGAMLQGVPDMNRTPGIDMSTGSLGQGLSAGNGMALGAVSTMPLGIRMSSAATEKLKKALSGKRL